MPAPSLATTAMRTCQRYARSLNTVGGLPYEMVRPILLKIDNPEQLHEIEHNSPQIIGKSIDLWQAFVARDIPQKFRESFDYEPKDPARWYDVYRKLKAKKEKQEAKAAHDIQMKIASNKSARKAPKVINPLVGPRLLNQRTGFSALGSGVGSRAQAGKSILNSIRGSSGVRKGASWGGQFIKKPPNSTFVKLGTVKRAPLRMVEEKVELAARSRLPAKIQPGQSGSSLLSASFLEDKSNDGVSIVEQRRQANERLKSIGLQSKPTPPNKHPISRHASPHHMTAGKPTAPSVFMARRTKKPS